LSALHVSGDVFAHHQEHLAVFTVFGGIHPVCCRLVSWMSSNCSFNSSKTSAGSNLDEYHLFSFLWRCDPTRVMSSSFLRFLDHTQRRTTAGRAPLDERSARRRDLYLTTHNTHNRQTSMPPVGFEPTISAGERPQTYGLERGATGTGG